MTNPYFDWPSSGSRLVTGDTARASDVNDALDDLSAGLDSQYTADILPAIRLPSGTADQRLNKTSGQRANKVLAFDGSGNITLSANDVDSAGASAASAASSANFKGYWSSLTGALAIPASVSHNGSLWLLLSNVADVTAHAPGVSSSWQLLSTTPALALLATYDAAGASAVDIESLSSSYDDYIVMFSNVVMSSVVTLSARIKKSGAYVTGSTYKALIHRSNGSTVSQSFSSPSSIGIGGSTASTTFTGQLRLSRANSTSGHGIYADFSALASGGGDIGTIGATETTAATITGIRFYVSSGTFTSGTFKLYGVAK